MASTLRISSRYSKSCGNVIFSSSQRCLDRVAVFAFVAQVTARFHARALAEERHREALAERVVVDAHRGRVEDLDRVRVVVRVEDRDREVVAVRDFDRPDDEGVLCRKELVTALVSRAHLVEDAVGNEAVENLAERGNRCQRLRSVAAGVDDLQGGRRRLSKFVPRREGRGMCRYPAPGRNPPDALDSRHGPARCRRPDVFRTRTTAQGRAEGRASGARRAEHLAVVHPRDGAGRRRAELRLRYLARSPARRAVAPPVCRRRSLTSPRSTKRMPPPSRPADGHPVRRPAACTTSCRRAPPGGKSADHDLPP